LLPFKQRRNSPISDQHKIHWPETLVNFITDLFGVAAKLSKKEKLYACCVPGRFFATQPHWGWLASQTPSSVGSFGGYPHPPFDWIWAYI